MASLEQLEEALRVVRMYRGYHSGPVMCACEIRPDGLGRMADYRCKACKAADKLTGDSCPVKEFQQQPYNRTIEGRV